MQIWDYNPLVTLDGSLFLSTRGRNCFQEPGGDEYGKLPDKDNRERGRGPEGKN